MAAAGRFEVREGAGRSAGSVLWMLAVLVVPLVVLWSMHAAYGDLRDNALLRVWAIGLSGAMVLVVAALGYAIVATAARGARRALVVAVDGRGITLGGSGIRRAERFWPWPAVATVRTYVTCGRGTTGEDPPLEYTNYVQVELRDGSRHRRVAPAGRRSGWAYLTGAVRSLAPGVSTVDDGVFPEGVDPYR